MLKSSPNLYIIRYFAENNITVYTIRSALPLATNGTQERYEDCSGDWSGPLELVRLARPRTVPTSARATRRLARLSRWLRSARTCSLRSSKNPDAADMKQVSSQRQPSVTGRIPCCPIGTSSNRYFIKKENNSPDIASVRKKMITFAPCFV